jgi:hypothetical protein
MPTEPPDSPALSNLESAVYRVALDVDSLILNGVQLGLLTSLAPGFLQDRMDDLRCDMAILSAELTKAGFERSHPSAAILEQLRLQIVDLMDRFAALRSFRSLHASELRAAAGKVRDARSQCVGLIEDLERSIHASRPFYSSRSIASTRAMDEFLAGLEKLLEAEWGKSQATPA